MGKVPEQGWSTVRTAPSPPTHPGGHLAISGHIFLCQNWEVAGGMVLLTPRG